MNVSRIHLDGYIYKNVSNQDKWDITSKFIWQNDIFPDNWYFVHWQNEEWRSKKVSKTNFYYQSALSDLLYKSGLAQKPNSTFDKMKNTLTHSKYFRQITA